jgi:hypothetical protein
MSSERKKKKRKYKKRKSKKDILGKNGFFAFFWRNFAFFSYQLFFFSFKFPPKIFPVQLFRLHTEIIFRYPA